MLDEPTSHAWYRRPVLWAGVLLLALVAIGLWYWQAGRTANAAPIYTTQTVARGNLTLTVIANGTLQLTCSISLQAGATIKEARASLGWLEEVARLSGGKVPSKAELDAGRVTLDRVLADDASARAGVRDAQAALSTDLINLSKASIVAPADGVVLTRSVDPGNAVAASLQAVMLFTVADDLTKRHQAPSVGVCG